MGSRTLTVNVAEPKKEELEKEGIKSVFVGGLVDGVTEDQLKELFAVYGEVAFSLGLAASIEHWPCLSCVNFPNFQCAFSSFRLCALPDLGCLFMSFGHLFQR